MFEVVGCSLIKEVEGLGLGKKGLEQFVLQLPWPCHSGPGRQWTTRVTGVHGPWHVVTVPQKRLITTIMSYSS